MKTIEQQIACRCKHFTGLMSKSCKALVLYDSVKSDDRPIKLPCFNDSGMTNCSKAEFLTPEEVVKEVREMNESTGKAIGILVRIKSKYNADKQSKGTTACPCGGIVHYSVASSNGHVWAKCNTCDLSLME